MVVAAGKVPRTLMAVAILALSLLLSVGVGVGAAPGAQVPPQVTPRPAVRPVLLTDAVPDPKQPGVHWFAPTGHTLRGIFLDYWNKYGGLYQFGYPLTEEFFEPVGADNRLLRVQYFERNRFEFHPEFANTQYEVLLGSLGRDFRTQDPPAERNMDPSNAFFGETGHNLYGPFRAYWETHGGAFVHGFPMTEAYIEKNAIDGKMYLVQYFERSRFELHPENAGTRYEILLGLLGRQLSEKKGFPHGWYPLYGHAPDWSWVAGSYEVDFRRCANCGCQNLQYTYSVDPVADRSKRGVRILPYGPTWFDVSVLGDYRRFLVVFGRLDFPIETEPERTETCQKPTYLVARVQTNP